MMATLTDLPMEVKSKVCFELSNPEDRYNLGHVARSLKSAVDDSWRDLQTLTVDFAAPPLNVGHPQLQSTDTDDSLTTDVQGTMTDPENGERSSFSQRIRSSRLLAFLKWAGSRLPGLKLTTNDDCAKNGEPILDTGRHPITTVLSACADLTVTPNVVHPCVESRRLLCDRSLLDALIRWADYRRRAADIDDMPFWIGLTLRPGSVPSLNRLLEVLRLRTKYGPPPADIRLLLDHGIGEVMFDADDPMQPDSPSRRWRKGLKRMQVKKLRMLGSCDPKGDSTLVRSLLQKLFDRCESLQILNADRILMFDISFDSEHEERATTRTMFDQLCRLRRLRQLHFKCSDSEFLIGTVHVNNLADCCPNLQDLEIRSFEMIDLLISHLLRECLELRTVYLRGFDMHLTEPIDAAMLFDIAADVGLRKRRVVITVDSVVGFSRELFDQIVVDFPPDVRLCHSDFDDRQSLVIGHRLRLDATVVLTWRST